MTIRSEIETRLGQFAASQNPPIPVALENSKFTKPTNGPYISIYLLAKKSINRDVAAQGIRTYGKAQINVYAPLNDGMGKLESIVSDVKNLYPVLPKIGTVSIEKPCDEADAFVVDNFICIPITVSYRVEL